MYSTTDLLLLRILTETQQIRGLCAEALLFAQNAKVKVRAVATAAACPATWPQDVPFLPQRRLSSAMALPFVSVYLAFPS